MKKLDEEDFLKYECSEKVNKALDLERIHQVKLTEEFEKVMKKSLKERIDKYTEFFRSGTILLKEFLDVKNEIEMRKLLEKMEFEKKEEKSKKRLKCVDQSLKVQENTKQKVLVEPKLVELREINQKVCKSEKCDIFKILERIPVITKQSRPNKFIPRKIKDAGAEIIQNTTGTKPCLKLNIGKREKRVSKRLPEYFFFKKFNEDKKFDEIYEKYLEK